MSYNKIFRFKFVVIYFFIILTLNSIIIAQSRPYQFVAKLYTEALGRIPDPSGWSTYTNMLNPSNLLNSMKTIGKDIYKSPEFTSLYTNNSGKLLALYRGALNREPDLVGYNSYLTVLNNGTRSWSSVVDEIFNSYEFANGPAVNSNGQPYGWNGAFPVINIPGVTIMTQTQLQTALNSAVPNGTVEIPQMTIVHLNSTLNIPAGVTLKTNGDLTHYRYALMARLIMDNTFGLDPLITMQSGSRLQGIWIDGQVSQRMNALGSNVIDPARVSVYVVNGNGSQVSNCRLSDPSGWTNIFLEGYKYCGGCNCSNQYIGYNLITGYANSHFDSHLDGGVHIGHWSDGISNGCQYATIEYNEIVDVTDVGIVVFRAAISGSQHQQSVIRNNNIFNAGNSAFAAFSIDPTFAGDVPGDPSYSRTFDFSATIIENNTIWTSPNAHVDMGISSGTRSFFLQPGRIPNNGSGVVIRNNNSGNQSMYANIGFLVNGMLNNSITGNSLSIYTEAYTTLREGNYVKNLNSGFASGTLSSFIGFSDGELQFQGHRGLYIIGPENISAPPKGLPSQTYTWSIKFYESVNGPYTWSKIFDDGSTYTVGTGLSYTETLGFQGYGNDIVYRLKVTAANPNNYATKYIKKQYAVLDETNIGKDFEQENSELPKQYELKQNYPNPFNPTTLISYLLPEDGFVTLKIFDILGNEISVLENIYKTAGTYSVSFDASELTSGIYFYTITSNNFFQTKKMLLIK
jgi:hypothetical protein